MEKLVLMNPYQNKHIKMIEQLEQDNNQKPQLSSYLKHISLIITQEEYRNTKKRENTFEEYMMLEESSQAIDICQIQGEKDRKVCQITFPFPIISHKRKAFILNVTDYCLNQLGMMEVLIHLNQSNKEYASFLEKKGYENLGEEEGKIIYLKEKVIELDQGKKHESSR